MPGRATITAAMRRERTRPVIAGNTQAPRGIAATLLAIALILAVLVWAAVPCGGVTRG